MFALFGVLFGQVIDLLLQLLVLVLLVLLLEVQLADFCLQFGLALLDLEWRVLRL